MWLGIYDINVLVLHETTVTVDNQVVTPLTNKGCLNYGYLITMETTDILILTTLEKIHRNYTDSAIIETRKPWQPDTDRKFTRSKQAHRMR